jgi:HAD superfamily hydrolase (TIGR01509 family)
MRAVLFDLDGVLVDTEPLKGQAHVETVESFGGEAKVDWYKELMGESHDRVREGFLERSGLEVSGDEYDEEYRAAYARFLRSEGRLRDGARALMRGLRARHVSMALVTSSGRKTVERILDRFGLRATFDVVVSAGDVAREKPAPDPYRKALAGLSVPPSDAVVLEDSESGVRSAVAAGIRVLAIRHAFNGRHDLSGAVRTLDHLPDLETLLEAA